MPDPTDPLFEADLYELLKPAEDTKNEEPTTEPAPKAKAKAKGKAGASGNMSSTELLKQLRSLDDDIDDCDE